MSLAFILATTCECLYNSYMKTKKASNDLKSKNPIAYYQQVVVCYKLTKKKD